MLFIDFHGLLGTKSSLTYQFDNSYLIGIDAGVASSLSIGSMYYWNQLLVNFGHRQNFSQWYFTQLQLHFGITNYGNTGYPTEDGNWGQWEKQSLICGITYSQHFWLKYLGLISFQSLYFTSYGPKVNTGIGLDLGI